MANDLGRVRKLYLSKFGSDADSESAILANIGPLYSVSIGDDLSALDHLPNNVSRLEVLQAVEADLSAKAAAAASAAATLTADSFAASVIVTVTIQPHVGQSLPANLTVLANNSIHKTRQPATYIFSTDGTSFRTKLPPGRFCIWVASPGNTLMQISRDVGSNGSSEEVLISLN